jgi:hypothetical protein
MNMKNLIAIGMAFWLGATALAFAGGPTNFFSFTEETKIKGAFVQLGGELYFNSEKGGTNAYGYIGKFCPTNRQITVLVEFSSETKAKGLAAVGDELWFVTEKGGAGNYGYVGCYNPASNTVESLCDFETTTSAKSAPFVLGTNGFYFFTEAGGANGVGALRKYSRENGLATVASFSSATGTKPEAPPVYHNGILYFGGREGGDTTQQSGKGAGTIGTIDLASGTVVTLVNLNATNHGSRVKALLSFGNRIYYTTDEGGDLSLNSGKGNGAMGVFDPATFGIAKLFTCNGSTTGTKPKGLVAVEDRVYFNCGEGAANGCGSFYVVTGGTNIAMVATNDIPFGNKSDRLTLYGNRIFCATEQGCSNFLGGISAFEADIAPRELAATSANGQMHFEWDALANDCVLEYAPTLTGDWQAVAGPSLTNVVLETSGKTGFFRLRR